ncbi:SDR family oxidoreductase [Thermoleophilia bacterium SCSIO 60948]|nr:SDR family oxidoreductase [Thermoleophilia bacterium SCSIO 60948]
MHVVVAGGHGKIAMRLLDRLTTGGDRGVGLIRNPDHAADLEAVGAEAQIADLEQLEADELVPLIEGADAIVFAAGAGPGSGPERKRTLDLGGAVKLIEAARNAGVDRYVIVSSMGAGDPESAPEEMKPYQRAKGEADEQLSKSGLAYTIVRPGSLTDDPGVGTVTVGERLEYGSISRDDVAAVLVAALETPGTIGKTFDLIAGDTPIDEALAAL